MHPLSLFPGLFFLSPLSATILRIGAALVFLYLARYYYEKRVHLSQVHLPIVGRAMWTVVLSMIWCTAVGVTLFFGWYTQLAAICGAVVAVKYLGWKKFAPEFVPLTYVSIYLLLVICTSLIVTGAGAFAFDLPL